MIQKLICWLFGHRRYRASDLMKDGEIVTRYTPSHFCTRCGTTLGEWWLATLKERHDE